MNKPFPRLVALLSFGLAAPLLASAALADTPAQDSEEQAVSASVEEAKSETNAGASSLAEPSTSSAPAQPEAVEQPEEEKVICRHIRLDTSSRRKTRVCRTEEGWRALNQQR